MISRWPTGRLRNNVSIGRHGDLWTASERGDGGRETWVAAWRGGTRCTLVSSPAELQYAAAFPSAPASRMGDLGPGGPGQPELTGPPWVKASEPIGAGRPVGGPSTAIAATKYRTRPRLVLSSRGRPGVPSSRRPAPGSVVARSAANRSPQARGGPGSDRARGCAGAR